MRRIANTLVLALVGLTTIPALAQTTAASLPISDPVQSKNLQRKAVIDQIEKDLAEFPALHTFFKTDIVPLGVQADGRVIPIGARIGDEAGLLVLLPEEVGTSNGTSNPDDPEQWCIIVRRGDRKVIRLFASPPVSPSLVKLLRLEAINRAYLESNNVPAKEISFRLMTFAQDILARAPEYGQLVEKIRQDFTNQRIRNHRLPGRFVPPNLPPYTQEFDAAFGGPALSRQEQEMRVSYIAAAALFRDIDLSPEVQETEKIKLKQELFAMFAM